MPSFQGGRAPRRALPVQLPTDSVQTFDSATNGGSVQVKPTCPPMKVFPSATSREVQAIVPCARGLTITEWVTNFCGPAAMVLICAVQVIVRVVVVLVLLNVTPNARA